ncbi:DUF3299 domain-containing protein [Saccharospirillum impatiens]|uniref:DUF3299 domain-containing protein n=1 Tax=Saccharospirillum impatiens TaxID=169438 RepID=UPI0003FCF210|nr:DUF3299 domain-containing protein [Saccharospirillum impatiens]
MNLIVRHAKPWLILSALLLAGVAFTAQAREAVDIQWDDLMPADFTYKSLRDQIDYSQYDLSSLSDDDPEAQRLYSDMTQLLANAPVVDALAGANVRLAGFVVPLEMDGDSVYSFLLVPYYGACIHTPPPPSNQIVFVQTQGGYEMGPMDEPVYVSGTLMVEAQQSELGSSGYTLYAGRIDPYL